MNDPIQMLFQYDAWATAQLMAAIQHLTLEQFTQEFGPQRASVQQQFVHLVSVADRAGFRLLGEPVPAHVEPQCFPLPQDVVAYERQVRERLHALVSGVSEDALNEVRDFATRSGTWRVSGTDTLFQVINHGTYHRGQIAMLLKMHGVSFPDTDFIVWRDARREEP